MTSYHYPTWANIVGRSFDTFENWGRPSAGNNYILNAINRCHLQNQLGSTDTVLVLWSGLARIDYYQINEWSHLVNQYYDLTTDNTPVSCPDGYQWLSFAWMSSAQHILENLKVRYRMFHWQPMDTGTDAFQLYQSVLAKITPAPVVCNTTTYQRHPQYKRAAQLLYERTAGEDWPVLDRILDLSYKELNLSHFIQSELDQFLETIRQDKNLNARVYHEQDYHPTPLQHLEWTQKHLPEVEISKLTVDWIQDIDHKLQKCLPYEFKTNFV